MGEAGMDYLLLKQVHVACAVLSYAGFVVRGGWMIRNSPLLERRWVRILPHANDTLLLASAIALAPYAARAQRISDVSTLPDPTADLYPAKRVEKYTLDRPITDEKVNGNYNNFYEFGTSKNIAAAAQALPIRPWTVKIDGMVEKPMDVGIDDLIRKITLEERTYRHRCVEAWGMAIAWTGFPFARLVELMGSGAPTPDYGWGGHEASGSTEIGGSGLDLTSTSIDHQQASTYLGGNYALFNANSDKMSNASAAALLPGTSSFAWLFIGELTGTTSGEQILGDRDVTSPNQGWSVTIGVSAAVSFIVDVGAALLRLADGLDRSHASVIRDLRCRNGKKRIKCALQARADAELEIWGARRKMDWFDKVFGRKIDFVLAKR